MPEHPYVILEEEEGLATVTMNRGEKRNPLSTAMMTALIDTFEKLGPAARGPRRHPRGRGAGIQRGPRSERDARPRSRVLSL